MSEEKSVEAANEIDNKQQEPTVASAPAKPKKSKKKFVIIGIVAVVVIALVVVGVLVFKGVLAPSGAAAKYETLSYVTEQETTDYIENYKKQVGYADAEDAAWAQYLSDNNMTPASLRVATIRQLIIDNEVEKRASELGLEVADSEVQSYIETSKNNIAMGDDETWAKTLEMYGQTEEGFEETTRHNLLQQKLFDEDVPMPSVTDEEVFNYMYYYYGAGKKIKHIYYLTVEGLDEDGSYKNLQNVQSIRKQLLADGVSTDTFSSYVALFCEDEDLVSRGGANGWDIDMSDMNANYQQAVENTKVGEVSEVFKDDNGYSFVYIDTAYKLPDLSGQDYEKIDKQAYIDDLPDSLKSYFSDSAAYLYWQDDCQTYLSNLYDNANVVLYPMPAGLSYDVDMSLATTQESTDDAAEATDSAAETTKKQNKKNDAKK